jgi:DNA repair protein RadC
MKEQTTIDLLATLVGQDAAIALADKPLAELFGFAKPRPHAMGEEVASYVVHPSLAAAKELIARCMQEKMAEDGLNASLPETVQAFLCSKIGHLEHEAFWCLWLNAQNRLIVAEEAFRGTITESRVYPRELVKRALAVNAAAVIFAHNHPSGATEPSKADETLTKGLQQALALVDVKVLDHFVVAGNQATSFAKRGLL